MKLEAIRARSLNIPFRTTFRHAQAERAATQTLWVEARAESCTGYGEGCPREYVTGETLQTAAAFCSAHASHWREYICDLSTLRRWSEEHVREIDRNPAAWAAVELALLDLLGKIGSRPVEALLGLPPLSGSFRYTAVLGDLPGAQFAAQLRHYLEAGFNDFKVKLSGDAARDGEKVRLLAAAGLASAAVRADANNLWPTADAAIAALEALDFRFRALEEPLRARDYAGMARVAAALDTAIVLDESLIRTDQLEQLDATRDRWIVNLRISKMGGLLRSLDVVSQIRRRRLGMIIGAQVGETSVLTRAALTLANTARDVLIAQEGAFGTHLLARDVVEPSLMFGAGGVLEVDGLQAGAGWSLDILTREGDLTELSAGDA